MARKEKTKEELTKEVKTLRSKIAELETAQSVYKQEARSAKVFKTIIDKVNYGVAISDLDGNLVHVNVAFAKMHGYSPDEVIGENLNIFHNKEQMKDVDKLNIKLKRNGKYFGEEVWHTKKDKTVFPTLMNASVIKNEKGKPLFLTTTIIDITESKLAESALRESEEKWRSLAENAPNIIFIVDRDGTIQFINRTVLGYTVEDVIGTKQINYIEPEYREIVEKTIEQVFKTGESGSYQIRGAGPNDSKAWYSSLVGPIKQDGKVVAATIFVTDITERKHAGGALKESEEKFRAIFDNALEGILLAHPETKKFFTGNNAICSMLGYDLEEIKKLGVMDIHPKEDLHYVMEQFEKQLKKEIMLAKDIPVRRKDGSVFFADINSGPVTIGEKEYLLGIFHDITERREAKIELENQKKILDETNKELYDKVEELQKAMGHIKRLEGLVPICARCKKIRVEGKEADAPEAWVTLESYISEKTEASLTHGLCPECARILYKKPYKKEQE
jgi:PAS domain S-box-containing protein